MQIMGVEYDLIIDTERCIDEDADGFCQRYEKKIFIRSVDDMLEKNASPEAKAARYREVLRHELAHAYLFEAGLDKYGCDEDIIVWLASKLPQMINTLKEMGCEKC